MKRQLWLVLLLILNAGAADTAPEDATRRQMTEVADGVAALGVDLYHQFREDPGNLLFSPLGVSVVGNMAACGARGKTLDQFIDVLHLPSDPATREEGGKALREHLIRTARAGGVQLRASDLFTLGTRIDLNPSFVGTLKDFFGVSPTVADASKGGTMAGNVNRLLDRTTDGQAADVLVPGDIPAGTAMTIVNVLYMKGLWNFPFVEKATQPRPFWLDAGGTVEVPSMRNVDEFRYGETDTIQLVALPYTKRGFAMWLFLPKARDGLADFEEGLTIEGLRAAMSSTEYAEVRLQMPRFSFTCNCPLNGPMTELGLKDAFNAKAADFSGISPEPVLFIEVAVQKSGIEVDEKGTKVYSFTLMTAEADGEEPPPLKRRLFVADHPFLFLIEDTETHTILFMGRVADPSAK